MLNRFKLTVVLVFICSHHALADDVITQEFDLSLSDDAELTITQFGSGGDRILWIPSEYGINTGRHYELIGGLSNRQFEIWLARTHESYFVPRGRSSYTKIPVGDISNLIQKSLPEDNRKLFIVTTGRGAVLSLLALKHWQNATGGNEKFGGIVMIHPNFQAKTPTPGEALEYLPIVQEMQVPIFILQPKKSNKRYYLPDLVAKLSQGGSQVYAQLVGEVSDGYHVRQDANEIEKQRAKELPLKIANAIKVLSSTKIVNDKKQKLQKRPPNQSSAQPWRMTAIPESLQAYPGNTLAPVLELQDIEGKKHNLGNYGGKVLVLNFWATWCPPCVKEIPSLNRLQSAFSKEDLVVLTIDVGESKQDVDKFLKQVPTALPVLLNLDGDVVKQWKVIAFPTTFIIDKQGLIVYTYFGGLEWDNPGVIQKLQEVIQRH